MVNLKFQFLIQSIDSIDEYGYSDKISSEHLERLRRLRQDIKQDLTEEQKNYYIKEYEQIAIQIWKEYLNPQTNKKTTRYLLHNIGHREYYDEFNSKIISTSLVTDKQAAFYRQMAGGVPNGFIVKAKNIVSATPFDNAIDNLNTGFDEGFRVIQLPYELEYNFIKNAQEKNEYLKYEENKFGCNFGGDCNEVACNDFDIVGYFFVSFGEGELNPVHAKAKKMADARGIELKEIDFSNLRVQNGLTPLNDDMKKVLFQNLLTRLVNELRKRDKFKYYPLRDPEFVEHNYENFAKRYIKLKETPDFNTVNILREFRETLLDNEYKKYKENSTYVIGTGIYIGELTEDDQKYIAGLKRKDIEKREKNDIKAKQIDQSKSNDVVGISWGEIGEGTITEFKKNPNNIEERIRRLREQVLNQDKSR